MNNLLFNLWQITDSNFPSGAFSHSFGMETYIQEGVVTNTKSFSYAIQQFIATQFIYIDGLACRMAFEAIKNKSDDSIWEIDRELYALTNAKEVREGNRRIGRQLLKVMSQIYGFKLLNNYQIKIEKKAAYGHSSIVFAIVCEGLKANLDITLSTYLFSTVTTIVQNGVRGIPIGQTDGQKIIRTLHPFLTNQVEKILSLSEQDFGGTAPGLEIAQMMHESLSVRLFMS